MPESLSSLAAKKSLLLNAVQPDYPANIPGSWQAQDIRNSGKRMRAGDRCSWCVVALWAAVLFALAAATLFLRTLPTPSGHPGSAAQSGGAEPAAPLPLRQRTAASKLTRLTRQHHGNNRDNRPMRLLPAAYLIRFGIVVSNGTSATSSSWRAQEKLCRRYMWR